MSGARSARIAHGYPNSLRYNGIDEDMSSNFSFRPNIHTAFLDIWSVLSAATGLDPEQYGIHERKWIGDAVCGRPGTSVDRQAHNYIRFLRSRMKMPTRMMDVVPYTYATQNDPGVKCLGT